MFSERQINGIGLGESDEMFRSFINLVRVENAFSLYDVSVNKSAIEDVVLEHAKACKKLLREKQSLFAEIICKI